MSLTPARRARRSCSKREISARNPWSCTRSSTRSEEHTSELQSPCNLVCRLLLEKKNTIYDFNHLHMGIVVMRSQIFRSFVHIIYRHATTTISKCLSAYISLCQTSQQSSHSTTR